VQVGENKTPVKTRSKPRKLKFFNSAFLILLNNSKSNGRHCWIVVVMILSHLTHIVIIEAIAFLPIREHPLLANLSF
jgi:hypothetical protein